MKHLFSSGEILCHQNEKVLPEGQLIGDTLEYDMVKDGCEFICNGEMDGNQVRVTFKLDEKGYQLVTFRKMIGILMQSDVYESDWTEYSIETL